MPALAGYQGPLMPRNLASMIFELQANFRSLLEDPLSSCSIGASCVTTARAIPGLQRLMEAACRAARRAKIHESAGERWFCTSPEAKRSRSRAC